MNKSYFPQQLWLELLQQELPLLQQLWFDPLQQLVTKTGNGLKTGTLTGITTTGGLIQHGEPHCGLQGGIAQGEHWHPPQPPPNWAGSISTSTKALSSSANANWTKSKATKMTVRKHFWWFYFEKRKILTFHRYLWR